MCDPVVFAGRQTFSHLHFHFHSFPLLSPRHNAGSPCITQLLWLLAHTTSIRNPTSGRMACSLRPQHANMTVCQHFLQLNCYKVDGNQQKKEEKKYVVADCRRFTTGLPWDSWPKKSGYQLFGGRFWIFQSFRSQGRRIKLELSKLFFKFCPKKLLNFDLCVKKWAKNWWNCQNLLEMLDFSVFRQILQLYKI